MKTLDDIVALYKSRRASQSPDIERMRRIQAVMNNEVVLPLPELTEEERPAVANLAQQGMNQMARRVASVTPVHNWPSTRPGSDAADTRARNRARITLGWHHDNKIKRRLSQRSRFWLAYANSPVLIKPDPKMHIPRWDVKNPLYTFAGEDTFDDHTPVDCIFITRHTYAGLLTSFPDAVAQVSKPDSWDHINDANNLEVEFEMLEWWDDYSFALILLGHDRPRNQYTSAPTDAISHMILQREHGLGLCPVVNPGSISLDKQIGHFDSIVGMYQTQAALMALTVVGQRRTVWPREWLVANPNETPEVVTVPDPASGTPGVMRGGALETQKLDPSFSTIEIMNMLEANQRMTASLPSEFGGFSQSDNVRTGRRGQQVMGAAIDFTIAEAQDTFAESLYEENRRAIAIDKAYFNRSKTYFIATRSYAGSVHYTPSETWETDKHVVMYPIAGTDMQNLPIEGGQRVAMGTLSRRTFMDVDPLIDDPEAEYQQIQREGVMTAFLSSIQTQAANPEGTYQPPDLARIDELLAQGKELYEAIMQAHQEAQERQATPPETEPQAQPGLAVPGQGVEQTAGGSGGLQEGMAGMQQLLSQLGTTQTAQRHRS